MNAKVIAVTLLVAPLVGFAADRTLTLDPSSAVWVEGTSTVKSYKCSAKRIDAELIAGSTSEVSGLVRQATVVIPVAQLECGNNTMNSHMRKALKAETNANVQYALLSYQLNGQSATLKGQLTMAGQTKALEIPATVIEEADGVVRVKASTQLNMTEWGVKPPSLMMGTMKVRPNVTVSFDVSLTR